MGTIDPQLLPWLTVRDALVGLPEPTWRPLRFSLTMCSNQGPESIRDILVLLLIHLLKLLKQVCMAYPGERICSSQGRWVSTVFFCARGGAVADFSRRLSFQWPLVWGDAPARQCCAGALSADSCGLYPQLPL